MKRLRILVVEDEALIAMLLEDVLMDMGHEVRTAGGLQEAMQIATSNLFDAAILDVNLDGKPSFPIADLFRERGVPFAFVTGYGAMGVASSHAEVPVLAKPFVKSDLENVLTKIIGHER